MTLWTKERDEELCEIVADGPTDAEAFAMAAYVLLIPEDVCRRRFALLANRQEALDWRPDDAEG